MGSNTNRIPSTDFAEAMRLLGIDTNNPDRALVEVHIHEGCVDAVYVQAQPLNVQYSSTRARIGAPEPTADEEMEAFDQFQQAVETLSPNAQRHVSLIEPGPTIGQVFNAGFLAREQSMSLHTLGMQSSDQVERDQAFTRWQQERSNR